MWLFKKYRLTIYQLIADRYKISETSRYFPNISMLETIDSCFTTAKEKGTGVAISELRRSLLKPQA